MLALCLAILLSICTGFLLVYLCWPPRTPIRSDFLLRLFVALGLGFGCSSVVFFLSLYTAYTSRHLLVIDLLLACFISIILFASGATANEHLSPAVVEEFGSEPMWNSNFRWVPLAGFVIALGCALYSFAAWALAGPHGAWDAFAIWNLRARFLFRAGDQWRDGFSKLLPWSHTDYPLLVPASIARAWRYIGRDAVVVPVLLALVFTFSTVGLVICGVSKLRSRSQGFLAGTVLVSTPFFVKSGASEYADVPLSFFYLATILLVCMQDRAPRRNLRLLTLAGMTAAFAAWTKNEGLLFLLSVTVAMLLVTVVREGWRTYARMLLRFAIGVAPILIVILLFKVSLAAPSDIFSGSHSGLHQWIELRRYAQIKSAFLREIWSFGLWVIAPGPVLAFYLLLLGTNVDKTDTPGVLTSVLALVMTLMGYLLIYAIGPNDIQWWLKYSLNRLLLQLWPSAVFIFFLIARTPEQALAHAGINRSQSAAPK